MTDSPPTPDVPVLRHLTWDELHALEFGGWWGVSIGLAYGMGQDYMAVLILLSFRRILLGDANGGLAALRRELWYLTGGAFGGLLVGLGVAVLVKVVQQV